MNPLVVGFVSLVLLAALTVAGLPLGFGLMLVGFIGSGWVGSWPDAMAMLANVPFEVVTDPNIAVLPLFLLMSQIVFASGMGKDLFSCFTRSLGGLRGGAALAAVFGSAGFAALSASSMASTASTGIEALPEMNRRKYSPSLATGSIAAAGTLGSLIPPSSILIVFALLTGQSVVTVFAAGLIPGILQAGCYAAAIIFLCWWLPSLGPLGDRYTRKEKAEAFFACWDIFLLIIIVIGGLLAEWFTPTEAGAIGALGATGLAVIRKRMNQESLVKCFREAIRGTGTLYGMLIGAMIFGHFISAASIPESLSVLATKIPSALILAIIMMVYLGLGLALDAVAMLSLTVPFFIPLVLAAGIDPVWAGIVWMKIMGVSLILPPVGKHIFVLKSIAPDVPANVIFRGVFPFLIADIVHLALLLLVPGIVLWLPRVIGLGSL